MSLKEKYLKEANGLKKPGPFTNSHQVGWRSPSNIALIKYWGKKADQLPQNPSLSFTLKNACTETIVEYSSHGKEGLQLDFYFEGKTNPLFETRVMKYLKSIAAYLPFLDQLHLKIQSKNSFPHSSGIASSASSMSALALCLVQIEKELFNTLEDANDFLRKASFLARLGSGSAARSVFGEYVTWGTSNFIDGSTNEAGVSYTIADNNSLLTLKDAILITSKEKKQVSSSSGHRMMQNHPWADARYQQAQANFGALNNAIITENDEKFISIIENEALSLHALMLSSDPGYSLLIQNTWNIIERIRKLRETTGTFVTFTLDAGPNVHLIYKKEDNDQMKDFIQNELVQYCENEYWIDDEIGTGPERII